MDSFEMSVRKRVGAAGVISGLVLGVALWFTPAYETHAVVKDRPSSKDRTSLLEQLNEEQTAIARKVTPSVVSITGTKVIHPAGGEMPAFNDPFFQQFFGRQFNAPREWRERFLGSGAIISDDGYIITNNHVVEKGRDITVTLTDKRQFKAKVVGADPQTDLAVLKIEGKDLPALPWADSGAVEVGETVFAVGTPFGYSETLTRGMVSYLGRTDVMDGGSGYQNFIQTDAAINPGNSGGPLVNIHGEIVGINAAIASASGGFNGVGFAIPSNLAKHVVASIVKYGKVTRPWLGVTIANLDEGLAESFGSKDLNGALVNDVSGGSPAEKAGIQRGDIIVEFNREKVRDSGQLKFLVGESEPDSTVPVVILRDGKRRDLQVRLEPQPKDFASRFGGRSGGSESEAGDYDNALAGITVQELTRDLASQLAIPTDVQGVVVADVAPDSVAGTKGLKRGDVIQEVQHRSIKNLEGFRSVAAGVKRDETVLLSINREGMGFFVALTPSKESGKD